MACPGSVGVGTDMRLPRVPEAQIGIEARRVGHCLMKHRESRWFSREFRTCNSRSNGLRCSPLKAARSTQTRDKR